MINSSLCIVTPPGILAAFLCLVTWNTIQATDSECNDFSSSYGSYLKNHVSQSYSATGLKNCTSTCLQFELCESTNFNFENRTCELNDVDKHDFPEDYVQRPGYGYSGWRYKEVQNMWLLDRYLGTSTNSSFSFARSYQNPAQMPRDEILLPKVVITWWKHERTRRNWKCTAKWKHSVRIYCQYIHSYFNRLRRVWIDNHDCTWNRKLNYIIAVLSCSPNIHTMRDFSSTSV